MRLLAGVLTFALISATSSLVQAQEFDADDFAANTAGKVADLCAVADASALDRYALGFCYGWLEGVGQFYEQAVAEGLIAESKIACPPKALSREEWAEVLVQWVGADAARRDQTPLQALGNAAKDAFPCPQ